MQLTRPALATLLVAALSPLACQSGAPAEDDAAGDTPRVAVGVQVADPLAAGDAYAVAGETELPKTAARKLPGLLNVFQLSPNIWSGSEPHGEEAFVELARLGIKVILSVDGKTPDAEVAKRHGIRYVHVPIKYSGIREAELLRIAKTFRELEGPFYAHCFHGKHRGPAGAAVGRIVLDGASREQALAEMRQWCGTSEKYPGLYRTIGMAAMPSAEATAAFDWDFPAAQPLKGFRHAMIAAPRLYDSLEALGKHDFAADPEHPDIDAVNQAAQLAELFAGAETTPEACDAKDDFRGWLTESSSASQELLTALRAVPADGAPAVERAKHALKTVKGLCTSCHSVYRNE